MNNTTDKRDKRVLKAKQFYQTNWLPIDAMIDELFGDSQSAADIHTFKLGVLDALSLDCLEAVANSLKEATSAQDRQKICYAMMLTVERVLKAEQEKERAN